MPIVYQVTVGQKVYTFDNLAPATVIATQNAITSINQVYVGTVVDNAQQPPVTTEATISEPVTIAEVAG